MKARIWQWPGRVGRALSPVVLGFVLLSLLIPQARADGVTDWQHFWTDYQRVFVDPQSGRVIDWYEGGITTSEGQSYALFFALVANEPQVFARILAWTQSNLAQGDLAKNLPAWRWGKNKDGKWGLLSENHAADSDLWIAYDLLQAGRLWKNPDYTRLGKALAQHIAAQEVLPMKGVGPMLIPGEKYFHFGSTLIINPSYLPPFLLAALAQQLPGGPWAEMLDKLPYVTQKTAPNGFSPGWVAYDENRGFFPAPQGVYGSYNAIRVYLWAGMTDPSTIGAKAVLDALWGMALYMQSNDLPPLKVNVLTGKGEGIGPSGFSAAIIPFLARYQMQKSISIQLQRLAREKDPNTGVYGRPPVHYYNQNLALFALGWYDHAYRMGPHGNVHPSWAEK
ncbi:cellulose synthase complex periplasmic endoglucanase BcsZ [Acidithiobacillus sp. IBUN Pt1247-S3]|uniref:cellulose synthase complex periplasmic endoglucanase BcsZ n=1 Tax=Acidithiobacillus sp. IBUN Pt1247-S3 TaxID=3166642 RepID=UPI0034E39255